MSVLSMFPPVIITVNEIKGELKLPFLKGGHDGREGRYHV